MSNQSINKCPFLNSGDKNCTKNGKGKCNYKYKKRCPYYAEYRKQGGIL